MPSQIQSLIDKTDTSELVRDQIAAILASETASQQVLAAAALKDPLLWTFDVFTERTHPWERFLNLEGKAAADLVPVVNVWFDSETFDRKASNVIECHRAEASFNIDVYAVGIAASDGGTGQIAGDELAAREVQRTMRLVRNILTASNYTYLDLRPLVNRRMPLSITQFQPQEGEFPVQNVMAMRLVLEVQFTELSPQFEGDLLEIVGIKVKRGSDSKILIDADYDFT